ncbi:hypothetical protein Dimus_013615, partial [Dionaea muscipula]
MQDKLKTRVENNREDITKFDGALSPLPLVGSAAQREQEHEDKEMPELNDEDNNGGFARMR